MAFIPDSPAKSSFVPDNSAPTNPVAAIGSTPAPPEGSSPDAPATADLFGNDWQRIKSSFGDTKGVQNLVQGNGYKNVQRNKSGEMVGQYAGDNKWYKDTQGMAHPLNWLEGHTGGALPTAGMAGGAVVGGGLAAGLTAPTGPGALAAGYAGGVAGAGAGGGLGEAARVGVGKVLGVNDGEVLPQVKDEAINSAEMEAIGKPVGEAVAAIPGVKPAANWVADRTVRPALARLSQLASLGGTNYDAAMRLLQRPAQVLGSTADGQVAQTAKEGAAELAAATKESRKGYSASQNKFFQQAPPVISTDNAVGAVDQTLGNIGYKPNSSGYGAFDGDQVTGLQKMKRSFQTEAPKTYGMAPDGAPTPPGAPPMPGVSRPDIEVGRGIVPQGGDVSINSPGAQNRTNPLAMQDNAPGTGNTGGDSPIGMDKISDPKLVNQQSPKELAGNLQYLRQASKPGSYTAKGAAKFRPDAEAGANKAILGGLKEDFHAAGSAGQEFNAADDKAAQFMTDADNLKGIENPVNAESWANGFGRKNKTAIQQSAQSAIPQTYEKLADIGAYNSFGNDGAKQVFGPTSRAVALMAAGNGMEMASGHPLGFAGNAALGAWALGSYPGVQRAGLGMAGKMINQQAGPVAARMLNPWANQGEK